MIYVNQDGQKRCPAFHIVVQKLKIIHFCLWFFQILSCNNILLWQIKIFVKVVFTSQQIGMCKDLDHNNNKLTIVICNQATGNNLAILSRKKLLSLLYLSFASKSIQTTGLNR